MSNISDSPTPLDQADLSAPIKTVQDTAADFSTDIVKWVDQSNEHAILMLCALVGAGIVLALLRFGLLRLIKRGKELPRRGLRTVAYRLVKNTSVMFLLVLGSWIIEQYVKLPKGVVNGIDLALMLTGFFQAGLLARAVILMLIEHRLIRGGMSDLPVHNALGVLGWLVNLVVWSVTLLVLLDNMGVNVNALVAGLGIGGLALGLAAQGIISDLFSALSIVFDRPFVRGDFVTFGDKQGTVDHIGLKTSRIRALTGEMIVVSNNKLLGEIIHNHQMMLERRMIFTIGVTYDTPLDQLEAIPGLIRELVQAQNLCRFDRAHMVRLADSSIDFETVYYFKGREYAPALDAHQAILLGLMRALAERKVQFAYPTQTLYLARSKSA